MSDPRHSRQTVATGNHVIQSLEFADATARNAFAATAADVGRMALQLDTGEFYLLEDDSPLTWSGIGASSGAVPSSRTLTAGTGLTGGGDLSADRTFDVAANADGSIVVNANDVQVGVLATDAQHGNRGGGALHADVVAAGASGFMTGADKTKLDGIGAGADIVGPGASTDEAVARWDGTGGTALQDSDVTINDTGDLLPVADDTQDLGSVAARFAEARARVVVGADVGGTLTIPAGQAGGFFGFVSSGSTVSFGGGAYPALLTSVNATSVGGGTATVANDAGGGILLGSAYAYGAGTSAQMSTLATSYGSFCGGYSFASGTSTTQIQANGSGCFTWGYAQATGSGTHLLQGVGLGSFVCGHTAGAGSHIIRALGDGSFVGGDISSGTTGLIEATAAADGGFVHGRSNAGGQLTASALAAFAGGNANVNDITASGIGSFAFGNATSGDIIASSQSSVQFGPGTNAEANSLQVGTAGSGIAIKGTVGAFSSQSNGQIWNTTGGSLFARSAGLDVPLNRLVVMQRSADEGVLPVSSPATSGTRNSHPTIDFDDATDENADFLFVTSSYYGGQDISVQIHWVAATATTGSVVWNVAFERLNAGGTDIDTDSFAAVQTQTTATNATSGIVNVTAISFTQAQADAIAADDHFRLRVTRDADNGSDDMTGDAQLLAVHLIV